ncbi:thermopsin family protease [Sulfurisphaera javensis]
MSLIPISYSTQLTAEPRYIPSNKYAIGVSSISSTPISTNEVLGYVNISSIDTSSASLQFNAVIKATNYFGQIYDYWVQNIIEFNNNQIYFNDEIWNFTYSYANISSNLIHGNGNVYSTNINGHVVTYYSYSTSPQYYSTHLTYILFISLSYSTSYLTITIGYGTPSNPTSTPYDEVTIQVQNLQSATICISSSYTGAGLPYSIELVWGGSGNGGSASFSEMDSLLGIFYEVQPNLYSPFPQVYDYGFDTEESATNLQASLGNKGFVQITLGTPNPTFLTSFFTPLIPGWTEVTVIANSTYNINGYNFSYNMLKNYDPSDHYGLSCYISFTSPSSLSVIIYPIVKQNYFITPYMVTVIEPYSNQEYNTTETTFSLTNNYYLLVVHYKIQPKKLFLYINIPMWGLVNGTLMLVRSGFYYYGTIILLPPVNYTYISSLERYALYPNVTYIQITQNVSIYVNQVLQYYVEINSAYPLYAFINGHKLTLFSNWFNASCVVNIPKQTYYINSFQREILLNPTSFQILSPINYTAKWLTQYFVNITTEYPLLAKINNNIINLSSGWYNESLRIVIFYQIYNVSYGQREVLLNPINITVTSSFNYTANWLTQYLIQVSFPVNATINGKTFVFNTGWYNESEKIEITQNTQYVGKFERIYIYNKTPIIIIVNSPKKIIINATVQFYVYFEMSVIGELNGSKENFTSNWYNIYSLITLNQTYFKYISITQRIMYIPSDIKFIVTQPYNITFLKIMQYYIFFNSSFPLVGIVNGKQITLNNGWFNNSERIEIPFQYKMISTEERYALLNPENLTINKSFTYYAKWGIQYLITVKSNLPVHAFVNNTNESLLTGWYNEYDIIRIINITYYINSTTRYAIYNATPSLNISVKSPLNITVYYLQQYLVNINGKTFWAFKGSKITLYEVVPFYYSAKWIGTYTTNNNATITVESPVNEKIVLKLNLLNIISTLLTIVTAIVIISKKRFK